MPKKKESVENGETVSPENTAPPDELKKLEDELTKTKDLLLRTAAEFDNFKKRNERERENLSAFIASQTVKSLLIPYDNLIRAMESDPQKEDYQKGVEMTLKLFKEAFEKLGLAEFGEAGDDFDPELFEAVLHKEDDSLGENTVSRVLQKGYKFGDIVLRHAMVEVAN